MLALDATQNTSATTQNAQLVAKTSVKTAAHGGTTSVDLNIGQVVGNGLPSCSTFVGVCHGEETGKKCAMFLKLLVTALLLRVSNCKTCRSIEGLPSISGIGHFLWEVCVKNYSSQISSERPGPHKIQSHFL